MERNATFDLGARYKLREATSDSVRMEEEWVFHGTDNLTATFKPHKQHIVVLDVKKPVGKEYGKFLSVKVLSDDGNVGRLYLDPVQWERVT